MRHDLLPSILVAGLALTLGACASYAPTHVRNGQTAADVERTMGAPPTSRYTTPAGTTQLEYARGPYGLHTWMIDLDAGGQVSQVRQVLNEVQFATLRPGMARDEVLLAIGRPGSVAGAWRDRTLWYWRYENYECRWFIVTLTPDDRVQDAGYGPDPACEDRDDDILRHD